MLIDRDTHELVSLMGKPLLWWIELREWAEEQGYPNCKPIHPDSEKVCDHEFEATCKLRCVKCGLTGEGKDTPPQPTSPKPEKRYMIAPSISLTFQRAKDAASQAVMTHGIDHKIFECGTEIGTMEYREVPAVEWCEVKHD